MAGAPKGNKNSNKSNRLWADTIKRVVAQGDAQKLRKIAEKLVAMAESGDMQAIKELGDRIDGKATQPIEGDLTASLTVEIVRFADNSAS